MLFRLSQVVFNRYIVTVDLQLPHVSRQRQKCTKRSVPTVPQSESAATYDSNVSPQVDHLRNPEQTAGHAVQETVSECSPLSCHDDNPIRQNTVSCNSSMSQMSSGDSEVALIERNRMSGIHQTCKQKRSLRSSQIAGERVPSCPDNAHTVGSRSSREKNNTGLSKCSVDPVKGLRPRSPVYTRSRREGTFLKLRRINGRKRLFPSTVESHPALEYNLFSRRLKQSRSTLQNVDASQSETEKASPSQYDAENEVRTNSVSTHGDSSVGNICTSNLDSETVGAFHEVSGVFGGPDSLQVMVDDNLKNRNVDASQVEMYAAHGSQISCGVQNGVCDSNMGTEVGDPHAAVGVGDSNVVNDSHAEIQLSDAHARSGVNDSHTEIVVIDSYAECIVGNSHAERGVGDSHSEIGAYNTHTENGASDFQAELGIHDSHADGGADDSHSEVGVDNIHTQEGTGDSQAEIGVLGSHADIVVDNIHTQKGIGDSQAEVGVHNSHARNGVGDSQTESGISDCHSCVGVCSEVKVHDVSQSSGRESTEPDVAVTVSVHSGEENKKMSQVPKRQKLISNSSGSKRRIFGRSYSLIVTRSKSRCELRNKKRVSWLSPDFEYPPHTRQSRSRSRSEGRKVSRSTFSRCKSYKNVFVQNRVMKKTVAKNDRKVFPNNRCPCDTTVALSDVVRRRFRSGDSFRGTPQKPRSRSVSCSETVEKPFNFTNEFKDNMLTKMLSQTTQKCNTEVIDKPTNDINKVTLISNSNNEVVDDPNNVINILTVFSNSSNTSTENHSSGNVEKQTCCNNMITGVDKIFRTKVLDQRLCINDIVKMKAKALAARKFRPTSQVEDLQRKMMRELQSLYRPVQS